MAFPAHAEWLGQRSKKLLELRTAHTAVSGTGPGARVATQQIVHAYAVLLLAQFQAFCRDLHTQAVDWLTSAIEPTGLAPIFRLNLTARRLLDTGNATAGNIGSDFNRLNMSFWPDVYAQDSRNLSRRAKLDELVRWRNAIGHQDFTAAGLDQGSLTLRSVEGWLSACRGLATSFHAIVVQHLEATVGRNPQ
jgi:hypothetical protein